MIRKRKSAIRFGIWLLRFSRDIALGFASQAGFMGCGWGGGGVIDTSSHHLVFFFSESRFVGLGLGIDVYMVWANLPYVCMCYER